MTTLRRAFAATSQRFSDGERKACAAAFGPVLELGVLEDPVPYAEPAFACAAITNDLDLAKRAHRILDSVDPYSAVYLASKLVQRERPRDALTMLEMALE